MNCVKRYALETLRLQRDYETMARMIIGPIPAFADVFSAVVDLERRLNRPGA